MPQAAFAITPVRSAGDLADTIALFTTYANALGVDLAYQGFAAEMAAMPGKYAPPAGELLLARSAGGGEAIGCVGMRPIDPPGCCEMKRLYVSPQARGFGLGRALVEAVVAEAQRIGYREIRLDTLPTMDEAIALYGKLGFKLIAPYYVTPIEGTKFMAKRLGRPNP
jgi:ribosomal protein S18 acetylase RimI-like enzyme